MHLVSVHIADVQLIFMSRRNHVKLGSNCTFGLLFWVTFHSFVTAFSYFFSSKSKSMVTSGYHKTNARFQAKITPFGITSQFSSPLPVNPIILLFFKRFDDWDDLRLRASMICLMSRS